MATEAQLMTPLYDKPRKWIRRKRNEGKNWDYFDCPGKKGSFEDFLRLYSMTEDWPDMDRSDWEYLVSTEKNAEENNLLADREKGQAIVVDGTVANDCTIPTDEWSSWQLYRKVLQKKNFAEEGINEIERSVHSILKRLSIDTSASLPVKGLVIGNVQSGKTANMAGLMAMAADHGWNMFIILSGTIENLRIQTRDRVYSDLFLRGNHDWIMLDQLSKKKSGNNACPAPHWPSNLSFEPGSNKRHFVVCLKNSTRLKDLIRWLQWDPATQRQMRILVIDDEADQASVNTADVNLSETERKAINKAICAMVNGNDEKNEKKKGCYAAMNYVGYTATPYANVLNDSKPESLYPRNFISTLAVSKEYFGPQQIFGCDGTKYAGLDIVRTVSSSDIDIIKDIHQYGLSSIPSSLADSICWFLCCVSAMRLRGYRKPISMLVHTSQKIDHHKYMYDAISDWLSSNSVSTIVSRCEKVWKDETPRFTKDILSLSYEDYLNIGNVQDVPSFGEIREGITDLIKEPAGPVQKVNDDYVFRKGIHLCIDNSDNNPHAGDIDQYRLVYPASGSMPIPAPAFLVVGGATLSRGLTLEGLVSTFFLRTVGQADTLMQMGRWFGYRKGYELYPRIWLTQRAKDQFDFLSSLDYELRREIQWMEDTGNRPSEYAAKLKNTPKLSFIRLSAKNKTQKMISAEMDYSGSFNQTFLFDDDFDVQKGNMNKTKAFLESLGECEITKACNQHAVNTCIWRNVDFTTIRSFLEIFGFNGRSGVFSDIKPLMQWAEQMTNDRKISGWNVVFAGKAGDPDVRFANCAVAKIQRTRKKSKTEIPGLINIGVLRNPKDLISDIDLDGQPDSFLAEFEAYKSTENRYKKLRADSGLATVPQLIIYIVDKNSKASSANREDLNACYDLVGLCVNIPGASAGNNYVSKVQIQLEPDNSTDIDE